jgi:hypothetical protein
MRHKQIILCLILIIPFYVFSQTPCSQDKKIALLGAKIEARGQNANLGETAMQVFDGNTNTKWLDYSRTTWIQVELTPENTTKLTSYSLTSANDSPERDPTNWVLKASNDGTNWQTIDTQSSQTFASRFQTKSYSVNSNVSYRFFRLDMTSSDFTYNITQLAEWSLIGQQSCPSSNEYPQAFATEIKSKSYISSSSNTAAPIVTAPKTIDISLDFNANAKPIYASIYGNNAGVFMGRDVINRTEAMRHYKNASISVMRYPGGSLADNFFWDGKIPSNYISANAVNPEGNYNINESRWQMNFTDFTQLAKACGSTPVVTVNYGYARYGTGPDPVGQAASYAASWVRYAKNNNLNIKYWEVGNECFGGWEAGHTVNGNNLDGKTYGIHFRRFVDSMKTADPSIKIGAVVVDADDNNTGWGGFNYWNRNMLPEIQNHADFLSIHSYYYFSNTPNTESPNTILNNMQRIGADKLSVDQMVATYTSKPAGYFPLALTEYNTSSVGSGINEISYLNALFYSYSLAEMGKNGYGMATRWMMQEPYNSNGGTHGMLAQSDPNCSNNTPYPSFYPFYYFNRMVGDQYLPATSSTNLVKSYASKFSNNNSVGIVLLNLSDKTETAALALTNFPTAKTIQYYQLLPDANQVQSRKISINGVLSNQNAGGPTEYETISPFQLDYTPNTRISLPPYSITFAVVEASLISSTEQSDEIKTTSIFPNPAQDFINVDAQKYRSISIFDIIGKQLIDQPISESKITISNLTKGLYVVEMVDNNGKIFKQKLVVNK